MMEHDEVRDLEDLLEQCLGRMFRGKGAESLPWRPDGQTVHLMAKAAGAVYEGACHIAKNRPRRRKARPVT
ncbi:MAG: hypothetical protein ACK5A3_02510 [Planctomyces sp.]